MENEMKACFGARNEDELRRMPTWIYRILTDPDFMQLVQEFSFEQEMIFNGTVGLYPGFGKFEN